MIQFTHATTNQAIMIREANSVGGYMFNPLEKGGSNVIWLVIDKFPAALPVKESEEEVLRKLGLTKEKV